ncbi:MAG: hypothetical protein KDD10_12565 [Phaeodactylibacter sp.]|nr:hypothetical protein [Phaeodactylibacter sp.]
MKLFFKDSMNFFAGVSAVYRTPHRDRGSNKDQVFDDILAFQCQPQRELSESGFRQKQQGQKVPGKGTG